MQGKSAATLTQAPIRVAKVLIRHIFHSSLLVSRERVDLDLRGAIIR